MLELYLQSSIIAHKNVFGETVSEPVFVPLAVPPEHVSVASGWPVKGAPATLLVLCIQMFEASFTGLLCIDRPWVHASSVYEKAAILWQLLCLQ